MKNIQVIDSAINCSYSIYAVSEETFALLFPEEGQDIEFVEDFIARVGETRADELLTPVWALRVDKQITVGIHGTLFYQLKDRATYYPNKKETDLDDPIIQRSILFGLSSPVARPKSHRLSKPQSSNFCAQRACIA